jgi:hypothetical protein
MAGSEYARYVIMGQESDVKLPTYREPTDRSLRTCISFLDDKVIKGAFYVESVWYWPGKRPENGELRAGAHTHTFDEVVTFYGTDPENPYDLCGEIEFWLEDERYLFTRSCLVYVPRGLKHCPLIIRRVDRPIFHFTTGPGKDYR